MSQIEKKEEKEIPSWVFISKNGQVLQGFRVALMDKYHTEESVTELAKYQISFSDNQEDGWLMIHPDIGMTLFVNKDAIGDSFENMGPL